jgi:hypothetical protein
MKKIILCISVLCSFKSFAQPLPLAFSIAEEVYAPLENDTVISMGAWDDENWVVPIGFVFHYMYQSYDHIVFFGPMGGFGSEISFGDPQSSNTFDVLTPCLIDVVETASNSDISTVTYVTEGVAGNRIFKLQWNNCGVVGDPNGTMRVNYQVWLYENNHSIDFRYGPNIDFDNTTTGFTNGLPAFFINNWNTDLPNDNCAGLWIMQGETTSPNFDFHFDTNDIFSSTHLDDLPADGIVYHFGGEANSVLEPGRLELLAYPTMATSLVRVQSTSALQSVMVYDQMGRQVMDLGNQPSSFIIEVSSLANGIYTIVAGQNQTARFIKQ